MRAVLYPVLYVLIVLSPLIVIFIAGPETHHGTVYETGKAFALMGFIILTLQFILSSRRKWIERHYGLDILFKYHKGMAVLAGILILSHPLLLSAGMGNFRLLTSLSLPWYIWLGKIGVLLILIQVILSLFRIKLRIGFEKWRLGHNIAGGLLLAGAFIHSLATSGHDLNLPALRLLWFVMLVAALAFYVHHKFVLPAKLRRNPYTISGIKQETHNVWTLEMSPPAGGKRFEYQPGQFQFITLHRDRGLPEEEHHFTLSSSPTQTGVITSSIKESGDFTSTIGQTREGDTVSVEAPFGRFSHVFHPEDRNFVFIAGGIGITPIISMLRYMRDIEASGDALLIYANHTEKDIVFRSELEAIAAVQHLRFKIIHVLDQPDASWQGEKGYVDEKIMTQYVGDFSDKAFYICCPPVMRQNVLNILKDKGVKNDQIRIEIFSL